MNAPYPVKPIRIPALLVGGAVLLLALFVLLNVQLMYGYNNHPTLKFTPEVWKEERLAHSKKLDWVAKDLSETKSLVGMERTAVIAQLGNPDFCNYKDEFINGAPNQNPKYPTKLIYYLSTRSKRLILSLSENDRVETVIYGSTGGL